jgi:ABC-type multidrug transport system ATPase subunit
VFYAYLSGREILELSAGIHGLDPKATLERLTPLIESLGLMAALGQFADGPLSS